MKNATFPDSMQMWREAFDQLESAINAGGVRQLESARFSKALHQVLRASLGMRQVSESASARWHAQLDIPSRTEFAALAAAVQRIEDKLDLLLPECASTNPRPQRTRRPPARPQLTA
ncbi:hypothetical protein WKW79_11100 [Variovorax robiniae]|uniref:Poly(3-hydroxyalkanoate) polymerase subunit PhaE n=1 Tax=Variovorax robiniae TaxID=1836199 RepID=A0ABU8X623_9BURK